MSTVPAGRHVVRLEFAHPLPAPDATVRLIRGALTCHPGCELAGTDFAVTVGVPVPIATERSLAEVAGQVDRAIAGLGLPDHAVSTFSWMRSPGTARRAAGPAVTAGTSGWLDRPDALGWRRPLAAVG